MNMPKTIKQFVETFVSQQTGDLPQLDAQLIIAHVLDKPRTWIAAHEDTNLTAPQIAATTRAFDEYQTGTPLPYIIGHWEFFGLDFDITNDVLIPRPETELLVEKAITWLQASPEKRAIADIGTGSGAIAVTLAVNIPDARILATDISRAALDVAEHNAKKFNVHHRIEFVECDLLPAQSSALDRQSSVALICANLPYIPTKTLQELPIFGREPTLALDGGADGLDLYRRLFKLAPDWLAPHSMMLLEIESTLGVKALSLAYDSFSGVTIHLHQDLAGNDRLLEIMFI